MHSTHYMSARQFNEGDRTIFFFQMYRGIGTIFLAFFFFTLVIGFAIAYSEKENPAYIIIGIVSALFVIPSLFLRAYALRIIIDRGKNAVEIIKTFVSRTYAKEEISLETLEHITYRKISQMAAGPEFITWRSFLTLSCSGREISLFRGDSQLKQLGKDLADELHIQFVENIEK